MESASDLMDLLFDLAYGRKRFDIKEDRRKDFYGRELVCTPFGGNYMSRAGWVICVNGSPPRGTKFLSEPGKGVWLRDGDGHHPLLADPLYQIDGKAKNKFDESQLEIIEAFFEEHLMDKEKYPKANGTFRIKPKMLNKSEPGN